ncbi:MAG: hypothetical protein LBQ84_09330 [Flavobacteriaceae bacterium]|jgi:hypothetical protein|nr:hypothetical protein [Flavobacteriaceae bacterium]
MKIHKLLAIVFSIFLITTEKAQPIQTTTDIAISAKQNGCGTGGFEITLEDTRRHRIRKTVSYAYSGEDIAKQLNPGAAGKGVIWDFSGIDLSKYDSKTKTETDGKAIDYSTSPYKYHYPNATECYLTKWVITSLLYPYPSSTINEQFVLHYDTYDYVDENIEYGKVQQNYIGGSSSIDAGNYIPEITVPYPKYIGLKYTTESVWHSSQGSEYSSKQDSNNVYYEIDVDGEGTLILPNGKKFTDVLRYRMIAKGEYGQYNDEDEEYELYKEYEHDDGVYEVYFYISKQAGELLNLYGNIISFTDEWLPE